MANKINFEVGFTTNSKGLQELKSELAEIRALASNDKGFGGDLSKIQAMVKSANDLEYAMTAAFDVDLNTVNIQKFNQILKQSKTDLSQIQQNLAYAGTAGQSAFLKATAGLMQFNTAAKQTNQFLDSIATSFANTIKWSAMSSIVNTITGTIQKSYYYVKDLDSALNDIRIVTGKNADEMSRFAEEANNAAKALAVTTEDYTQGSLIYYQQGLDDETVKALTDITAKTSNVTGQSMSAVSEELTAVWNGYQVANEAAQEGMQVYEEYVDKMAAVGASTASDLEELSKAMSKVASAASSMGVGFDDLNAQIATIVSVTRQAPESVGTALKTIYARLGDLKVDGVDEFGVKLGEVSAQLKQMGIEVLDQNGNLRDMTPVMAEVAEKWNSWTEAQRQAAAVAMAGKRQYNNLIALFDNWDMYGDALKTSMEAAGTLEEQQEIALDSLSNKMDQLKATAEDLYDSLYDEEDIKGLVEGLTKVVQGIADFSDAIGGLKSLIPMLGSVAAGVFSNQIAKGLSTIVINAQNARKETQSMAENYNQLKMMFSDSSLFSSVEDENINSNAMKQGVEQLKQYYSDMQKYQSIMSQEQKDTYNSVLNNIAKVGELNIEIEKSAQSLDKEQKSWKLIDTSLLQDEKDLKSFSDQVQRTSKLATELGKALALSEGKSKLSRKEVYDIIHKIGKESKLSTEEIKQLKKEFQNLANKAGDNNEAFKQFVEQLQKTGYSAEEIQKLVQQMRNLRDGTKEVGDSLQNNLDLQKFISNITNTISAVGQFATSLNTLKNLGGIWNNEDLELGDKILQTIMNLSFAIPGLIAGFNAINTLLGVEVSLGNGLIAQLGLRSALRAAELKIIGLATKAKVEDAIVTAILDREHTKLIVTENGVTTSVTATLGALSAQQKQFLINTYATKEEVAALEMATAANKAFSLSFLASPLGLAVTALAALVVGLGAYNSAVKKSIEFNKEFSKQQIEEENRKQEEINKNQQIYTSFNQLVNAYEQGKATKEELKNATDNLNDAYQDEISALGQLSDSYKIVAEEAKNARRSELDAGITSAQNEKNAAEAGVLAAARGQSDTIAKTKNSQFQYTWGVGDDYDIVKYFNKNINEQEGLINGAITNENRNLLGGYATGFLQFDSGDINSTLAAYDALDSAIKEIIENVDSETRASSKMFQQMIKDRDALKDAVESYRQAEKDLVDYQSELATIDSDFSNIKNIEDYNNALEDTKKAISEATGLDLIKDEERLLALAQTYMEVQDNTLSTYRLQLKAIEELKEKGNWNLTDDQYKQLFEKYSGEEISLVTNFVVDEEVTYENFDEFLEKAKIDYADQIIGISFNAATDMQDKIRSGKLTAENAEEDESFKTLTQNLDSLTAAYPELTAEAELLNHTWLIGTQEYSEALETVQDKLYELDLQKAYDEVGEQIDEFIEKYGKDSTINIDADASEFAEEMEKILQAEYEIDVKIHAEAENEFNSIEQAFDDIHDKAELIGDDFKVSANNIRELNNAFPGILEGMKILGDGTVQLNEQIVQSSMEAAEAEAQADAEATYAKLEDQAKLLRAKQATYESMAKIALELANTEVDNEADATRLRGQLSDQLTYLKELNSADAANSEQDDNVAVADSSNVNAKQVADNWRSAFQVMADSSLAAAQAAIQNMNAVAGKGNVSGTVDLNDYQYTGGGGTTGESKIVEQVENIIEGNSEDQQKEAAKMAEQLFAMADASGKAANDIEGMMAQIAARGTGIDKELNGVASGLGSDSKKDKSKSKKEHKDDEVNRYWEIEKALEKIADALKKVDKLKSHTFGKQKIQVLKQESELIKQQTKLYEQLYEEQKKEAEELRGKLGAGGMTFSAEGEITNYGEALKGALASYNKAVDDFNAGLINDEGFKAAEQNYEKFKKNVERYDKLFYSEMKDTREKIEEEAQKLRDIQLESFEIKVQVKIDKAQLRKDFRNFRKELKKDFTLEYEVLPKTKSFKKDFKDDKSQVNTYKKAAQEIEKEIDIIMAGGQSKMFATLSEAQEKLKEVNEKFQEASRNTMQDVEDAWKNYIALIDQTNEKLDDQIERYDQIQNELDDWKQMIELVYGDKAYDKMDDYYAQAKQNSLAQIDSLKRISDAWETQFQKALAAEGASMDRTDLWSEDLTKLYQNWINSEDKLRDATNNHIKLLKDDYANTVEGIIDKLDKDLTGGKGLEQMKKEWEETKEFADKYYNSVQKAYHIQTLNNKIQKSINKQSNIKNAQKLEKLRQKELGELRDMNRMSEYDLKVAEAKYDIALKEIALEESRNNKNTMKLSRNAEGNWSYQYVADEGDVEDRQQDLLDAYMNLQNISDEQMSKLMDEGLAAIGNLKEEIKTVYKKAEAEKWSQEKLEQELAVLKDKYYGEGGVITNISKEFEKARREAAESGLAVQAKCYELDEANFENLTIEVKKLFDEANDHLAKGYSEEENGFEKTFESANHTMANQWYDFLHNDENGIQPSWEKAAIEMGEAWVGTDDDSVVTKVDDAFHQINTKFGEYLSDLDTLQETSGIKFGEIGNYIAKTATETNNVNKNVKELVKQTKNIEKQRKEVEKLMTAWDKVQESIDKASKSIEDYLKKQQDIKEPAAPNTPAPSSYSGSSTSSYTGGGSGSGTSTYTPSTTTTTTTTTPQSYYWKDAVVDYWTKDNGWKYHLISSSGKTSEDKYGYSIYSPANRNAKETVQKLVKAQWLYKTAPYDTGGYTGTWSGNEGRLATLHQKELVLNAQDTENFLSATDTLRKLTSLDTSIEKSIASAISKMLINMAAVNNGTNGVATSNNESNTNNVFNINAEFPNANDVNEIREAILSLPNLASQYIHRSGI